MAVFLDTGIFVAARNSRDSNHARPTELLERALKGEFGAVYTSDYVVGEAVTTALLRTNNHEIASNVGRLALVSPRVETLYTGVAEFRSSWERFQKLGRRAMSFTDCVSLTHMERRGVDEIMSFDLEFDGVAARIR